jgi:predicted glycosyltransferase
VPILAATCPENTVKQLWVSHHPGIECIAAADIVVGGAGYNIVCESINLGVPLVAIAFPRLYDRQAKRAAKTYQVQNSQSAISTVRMLLEQLKSNQVRPAPSYLNGAIQAFDFIEQIINQ